MKRIFLLLLVCIIVIGPIHKIEAKENDYKQQRFDEILNEYKKDPMFMKELRESPNTAYQMINDLVNDEFEILPNSGSYGEASCYVPAIMQAEDWWCGYATTLQTIYGLGKEGTVNGRTDKEKQSTIANDMGHPQSSAVVHEIRDYLNKKVSANTYKYAAVKNLGWTELAFSNAVAGSLMRDRPVILHALTGELGYYNGKNIKHYLSVDYINNYTNKVRIKDCNYDMNYFGSHTVPTHEAFGAVNLAGRYIIYN